MTKRIGAIALLALAATLFGCASGEEPESTPATTTAGAGTGAAPVTTPDPNGPTVPANEPPPTPNEPTK